MNSTLRRILTVAALCLGGSLAYAADTTPPAAPLVDNLKAARTQIADKKWDAAISELKKVNDTGSADWNNLMGFSLRKSGAANYAAAEKFYDEALRIDPKHKGALEYSGELYLITGNLSKAEERLARLDKVCFLPCEEFTDLKGAVARYKAAGNKYVAQP